MPVSLRQIASVLALAALGTGAQAAPVFALTRDSASLLRFDTSAPGAVSTVGALSGATTVLDGIDFRPADNMLYGYLAATGGVYRVDTSTGVTTLVSTAARSSTPLGVDFNPAADRLRVVTAADQNLRINVATGATIVDGTLVYAAGDVNAGINPHVVEAAYTNNDTNPATGTTLYYIDDLLDTLVSTSSPNAGILNTIGSLGFDVDEFLGFDISTDASGMNTAFASLRVGGSQGLYTLNLLTGQATLLGAIGADAVRGLAVSTVPEPTSLALVGLAGLALMRQRRGKQLLGQRA